MNSITIAVMKKQSLVNHPAIPPLNPGNTPLTAPIYQGVKFTVPTLADVEDLISGQTQGYLYSRVANPTTRQLETLLARLQGAHDAISTSSGIAAISTTLLALLNRGDHIIVFYESYRPSRMFARTFLEKFGIQYSLVSLRDHETIRSVIQENTRVMLFESPSNPMTYLADLSALTQLARAHDIVTVLDNTCAGFHNHGQFPIDVFVHSLTKFACGHGDALGGVIIGNQTIIDEIRSTSHHIGACLDPNSAFLILRGMKTYFIRYKAATQNAMAISRYFEKHEKIETLLYPGLASHPQHALACQQMDDFGAIIAFEIAGENENLREFIDHLNLIKLAASLGSTETLIAPTALFYGRDLSEQERVISGISENTVRLAVGIENEQDIIDDIEQALEYCL